LLRHPCFVAGETCHGVAESEQLAQEAEQLSHRTTETVAGASDGTLRERVVPVELDGRRFEVRVRVPEPPYAELARRRRDRAGSSGAHSAGARDAVVSPIQGTVLEVRVRNGDEVRAGQV